MLINYVIKRNRFNRECAVALRNDAKGTFFIADTLDDFTSYAENAAKLAAGLQNWSETGDILIMDEAHIE